MCFSEPSFSAFLGTKTFIHTVFGVNDDSFFSSRFIFRKISSTYFEDCILSKNKKEMLSKWLDLVLFEVRELHWFAWNSSRTSCTADMSNGLNRATYCWEMCYYFPKQEIMWFAPMEWGNWWKISCRLALKEWHEAYLGTEVSDVFAMLAWVSKQQPSNHPQHPSNTPACHINQHAIKII